MKRNLKTDALVLRNYRIGDFHKGTVLLTSSFGILHAIAHGAYKGKSRLGSKTDVFNTLVVYLYHDPVKNSYKITDAECTSYFEGIKGNLQKVYAAYLIAEIVWKTYAGGGDYETTLDLMKTAFTCLDAGEPDHADRVLIQFLWRYMPMAGHYLDVGTCGNCGREIGRNDTVSFSSRELSFICLSCAGGKDEQLPQGCISYIRYTAALPFLKAVGVSMESKAEKKLKGLLLHLVESIVETGLQTLDSGGGFF